MAAPYREQQADGRKLEPDPSPRRKVHLAGATTVAIGLGIGATAPLLGPLAAVMGGGIALLGIALFREAPKNPMRAICPICTAEIGGIDPALDAVLCLTCGDYARSVSGTLTVMRDDFVANAPIFSIPVGLGPPREMPPICAECGASGVSGAVALEVNVPALPLASENAVRIVHVPHCTEHDRGAEAALGAVCVRSRRLWLAMATPQT
ncbi:MAG TPA: hypothetical protein VM580_07210 [Labilithrix sp.]|jgi:hypothetical protein|nr:hypothetical protein [Labilithrix sp.]